MAPDITALGKPAGVRCRHLEADLTCRIYPDRPGVCRGYRPDEICDRVAAPTLAERVRRYRDLFGIGG